MIKKSKYEEYGGRITKDGHTMFVYDILKELNRKSYLEVENTKLKQKNAELEVALHVIGDIHDDRGTCLGCPAVDCCSATIADTCSENIVEWAKQQAKEAE